MKKLLITGGAGFIGTQLSCELMSRNVPIRVLDSLAPQIHGHVPKHYEWLQASGVEFVRGSVTDRKCLQASLEGVTDIVHLAAETGTGQSMYEVARYNEVNSQGTALLLDILANKSTHSVERVVLASSRSVYGEGVYTCRHCEQGARRQAPAARSAEQLAQHRWNPICPYCNSSLEPLATHEDDPVRPASIYAATKYAQEDLVRVACEALGINYAILRFQNVYGEGQSLNNPYTGILSIFSTRIRRGMELPIFEDGLESRDFVHVDDVVNAISACLFTEQKINSVINVGSGIATSVLDVAHALCEALNRKVSVRVTSQYRLGDIRHNVADICALRDRLGVTPAVNLAQGLKRFADWVSSQPLPQDRLEQANAELRARKLMA